MGDLPLLVKSDGPTCGKGVLVTESWEEAIEETKAAVDGGCTVTIERLLAVTDGSDDE